MSEHAINVREAREIVEAFVAAVNGGRAEKVVAAMSGNPVFIDSLGRRIEGKQALLGAWRAYFRLFPDYRIDIDGLVAEDREAMLHGRASGTLHRDAHPVDGGHWEIPAAWRATTDTRRVTQWQVFADNKPVYDLLAH